jgi:predicted dehydrogenase
MGTHHARVLGAVPGARLAGVHDKHPERAAVLGERHGCAVFAHLEDVIGACDAAIVATSSASHLEVGRVLLEAGIPCLIEKPLALAEADCTSLIAAAAGRGVPLAVGHTERFNPTTAALLATIRDWRVRAIETRRLNPGSARITDTGVVSDLMLHDLDIVLRIMQRAPRDVVAVGLTQEAQAGADHAMALLSFDGPALASCAASRITAHRARELSLVGDRGSVLVDYLARTVGRLDPGASAPTPVAVAPADPLASELAAFVDTVRGGGPRCGEAIDGATALAALRLAWSIERQIARR